MPRKTKEHYPPNWKEIAWQVKERDGWQCQECGLQFAPNIRRVEDDRGKPQTLGVHHKDRNTLNNHPDNLITLCSACHCRAEWPLIRRELHRRRHERQLEFDFCFRHESEKF